MTLQFEPDPVHGSSVYSLFNNANDVETRAKFQTPSVTAHLSISKIGASHSAFVIYIGCVKFLALAV